MKIFTKQQVEKAFQQANSKIEKTARILGIRTNKAKQLLIDFEIPFEITNNKMKGISKEEIEKVYNECNGAITEMGKRFGITQSMMFKHLYKHGLHVPTHHSCDHGFFSKETEQAYYWAGFIAADGCVKKNSLIINITATDGDHLRQFKKDIQATQEVSLRPARDVKFRDRIIKSKESVIINITSQQNVKVLREKFNIVPAKSLIYSVPEKLLSSPLIRHFIRGLIDGDGSWLVLSASENKCEKIRLNICGTKNVCESMHKVFFDNQLITNDCYPHQGSGNYWKLVFQSDHNLLKIRDFLYRDATVFLQRKFEVASRIEETIKIYPFQPIENLKELHKLYEGDRSKISEILGVSEGKIDYALKKIDYDKIERTKINENFFKEEHYYWFGFLFDKLTIVGSNGSSANKIYSSIQNLEKINKIFDSEYKIKKEGVSDGLTYFSNILAEDFQKIRNNIFNQLSTKSKEQISEFIMGYVDARCHFYQKRHIRNKNKMFGIVGEEFFLVQFKNLLKSTLDVECELSDEKTSDDNNRLKLLFNHKNTIKLFDELYLLTIEFDSEIKTQAQEYKNKYENVIEIINSDLPGEEWRVVKKYNKPTKETFIEIAKQSKTRKEMAEKLNCSHGNISYIQKNYGITDQITEILKQNNNQ